MRRILSFLAVMVSMIGCSVDRPMVDGPSETPADLPFDTGNDLLMADEIPQTCDVDADCFDGNECTYDYCVKFNAPGYPKCEHGVATNNVACTVGLIPGHCDGAGSCCTGCFSFVNGSAECAPSCPSGRKCDFPNGACCQGCIDKWGLCHVGTENNYCGTGGGKCGQCQCSDGYCPSLNANVAPPLDVESSDAACAGCAAAVKCDDDNPCTRDFLVNGSWCGHANKTDGVACDDADGKGWCMLGMCCYGVIDTHTNPWSCVSCDDGNECTYDNGYEGCLYSPKAIGTPCGPTGTWSCNGAGTCMGT